MWGSKGAREREIFVDALSQNPKVIAKNVLHFMASFPNGTNEWWAHNGGKYDALFIVEALTEMGWEASAHVAAGRIVTLKIKSPNGTFTLHDSYAVVQSALKKAAIAFELASQKLLNDEDYSKDVRDWDLQRLIDGCYADCECVLDLLDVVETLFESEGGQLKSTFSSSALSVVRAQNEVLDMSKHVEINTLARMAYMGGRVEVFRHTPQYLLGEWDINSSYPNSMSQRLPWHFVGHAFGKKAVNAFEDSERYAGVVEATVKVSNCYLPVLPWRHPDHGGIYFPIGEWRGWFDRDELAYAIEQGTTKLVNLHSMLAFTREAPFEQFISSFYALKSKSTGAKREFYKLCLNGCYGKFAQKPEKEELKIFSTQEEAFDAVFKGGGKQAKFLSNYDCRFVSFSTERWPKQTHYALASAITAQSRIRLHEYLSYAKRIAYTDTDSIHAERGTSLSGFCSNELGALKLEMDNFSGLYAAPKIYALTPNALGEHGSHYACKGFPVSRENFESIISGATITTERMQLVKRQARTDNQVRRPEQTRQWHGLSSKRKPIYDTDGDTVPWSVEELLCNKHLTAESPVTKLRRQKKFTQ